MTAPATSYRRLQGMRERIIAYFGVLSLIGSGALILVLVYGAPWLGIEGIQRLKEAEIVRVLENAADLKKQSILTWLSARRTELAVLAVSSDFAGAVATMRLRQLWGEAAPDSEVELLSQHLHALRQTSPDTYDSLVLVSRDKKVLAASDSGRIGRSFGFGSFVDAAFASGAAEHIGSAWSEGRPVVLISRQVLYRERAGRKSAEVAAVIVGQTRPQQSLESLARLPGLSESEDKQLVLVGAKGELLASLPERRAGLTSDDPIIARLSERAASRTESWRLETLSDGRKLLFSYRFVPLGPTDGWGIAVVVDQEKAYAPLATTMARAAMFGLAMIAVALVFVGWGAGRFARPIRELRSSVLALQGGDFSARAATAKGMTHEITDLATAFNGMAQRIENSHQELERQVAERTRELRIEKENAQRYLDVAGTMLVLIGRDGCISMINRAGCQLLRAPEGELLGLDWFENFLPADRKAEVREVFETLMGGEQEILEFYENRILTRDGRERIISWHNILLRDDQGDIQGVLSSGEDITQKRQAELQRGEMERQLLYTQKLESLGVLAGGIAHDFNNLLMAIGGNLELVRHLVEPESPIVKYLENAHQATKRAGDLTRQMLAYSGKGGYSVKLVDLNRLVGENIDLMRASLRKGSAISAKLHPGLPMFEADPAQMQQVIVNLVTNAVEALGEGGTITVTTGMMEVGAAGMAQSRLEDKPQAGFFLFVQVADNGCGMDRATSDRMFDPFFSTKFTGRGLGLSAVQGIVRGHGGAVQVETRPGEGTTVRVLLPAPTPAPGEQDGGAAKEPPPAGEAAAEPVLQTSAAAPEAAGRLEAPIERESAMERAMMKDAAAKKAAASQAAPAPPTAGKTGDAEPEDTGVAARRSTAVLIVDDEEMVRLVCRAMVRGLGYRTMVASDGPEAVELFREHAAEIGVVIMDLSMPVMDGMAAAEELRRIRPEVRIVLSSGYSAIEEARRLSGRQGALFIQKPYDIESLKKVLGELDIDPSC